MNIKSAAIMLSAIPMLAVIPSGCNPDLPEYNSGTGKGQVVTANIEGCEYIVSTTYAGHNVYSHKGNCTNGIHLYRIEDKPQHAP